jgi:hypothetical protein
MSTYTDQILKTRTQAAVKGAAKPNPNFWGGKTHSITLDAHKQHLAASKQAKLDSTLYDPAKVLAGADLRNTVNSLADLQVNPVLSDLDRQAGDVQRQSDSVTANARAYYAQLAQRQQALADQAKTTEAASNAQVSGIGQAAQQAQAALAAANQQRMTQDQAVRGDIATTTADQLAKTYADRAAGIGTRTEADQTAQAVKNAAGSQAAIGQAMAAGQQGGEAITGLTNQFARTLGDISGKKTDTLASRGGLVADLTQKLRQQGYDNLITREGLNIKQSDLEATTAANQAKLAETTRHNTAMESNAERAARLGDKKYQLDKDKYGSAEAKDRYQKTHKLGPYKPGATTGGGSSVTPAQRDARTQGSLDFWDQVSAGSTILDQARDALPGVNAERVKAKQPILGWNDATARQVLATKGYKPYEIDAIIETRHNGGAVSAATLKKLKARHITVKTDQRLSVAPTGTTTAPPDFNLAGTLGGFPG